MEEFYLKVYLFKTNRVPPIKIARNSQLRITIETMDYTVPDGATASAFANGVTSEKVYTQSCTVSGNKVSFTPVPGFFVQGRNLLQYEIGGGVIPLAIDVNCEISLPSTGETGEPETVKPMVQRAEAAAAKAEKQANAAAGSAGSAAGSATAASGSAADALQSKNAAAGSASAAAGSAASAGQSANAAAGSASAALESKNAAAGSAQEALASKNAAANSANSAAGSASAASGSATAAAGSAQEALESKNTAAGSAQAAQEAMQKTQEISVNPSYIGDNGNWFVWSLDSDAYVDSGVKAQGPKGDPGAVQRVCGVAPDAAGNVALTAEKVGAATPEQLNAAVRKAAPRNLLDNSDFTNPVNQRGQTSYDMTAWSGYTIDRWKPGASGCKINFQNDGLNMSGGIFQLLPNPDKYNGKVLTVAAKVDGNILCASGTVVLNGVWKWFTAQPADGSCTVSCIIHSDNSISASVSTDDLAKYINAEWVALYEGEYTAETLPEYNPKGYGAELAECMRYFERLALNLMMDNTNKLVIMDRPRVVKRIYPTTIANKTESSESGASVELWNSSDSYIRGVIKFSSTGNQYWYGYLDISADL